MDTRGHLWTHAHALDIGIPAGKGFLFKMIFSHVGFSGRIIIYKSPTHRGSKPLARPAPFRLACPAHPRPLYVGGRALGDGWMENVKRRNKI